ncbi:DUF4153 domain-containing protein [Aquincola tertiaricarbonis]|uniref:DUF4153 domain-containing protein n=1 Tax=Aquincola tertiaricarbonis TaxID=391953 RepID=UPI000614EBAE|nr:DUF4153 domain-containing protein [Aquincola tertiaricarbonis]
MHQDPPPDAAVPASPPSAALLAHGSVGLAAGAALWLLADGWRALPAWAGFAGLYAIVAAAGSWILWQGAFCTALRRAMAALAMGAAFAGLGAHAGHGGATGFGVPLAHAVAALVLGFVVIGLVAGFDARRRRFDYEALFDAAWRNALVLPLAAGLSGVLWVLLWAAAWLMDSIGVPAPGRLLLQSSSIALITGSAFGLGSGLVLARAAALVTLRRFLLSLLTWFLPLTLLFAAGWLAMLAATGVEPLFATRKAALYLLWFILLAVVFGNAAFQSGREPPPYPAPLARLLSLAWLTMPPMAALACWALGLRIAQHGWTDDRIWAAVVAGLLTLHAVLYAASSLARGGGWMRAIAPANIAVALLKVVLLVALISPLADARRLGVQAQVQRLLQGVVTPDDFDWSHLARNPAYGRPALAALAAHQGPGPADARIASLAQRTLAEGDQPGPKQAAQPLRALALATVLPRGAALDEDMRAWLARQADWEVSACLATPANCLLWLRDFDGDGARDLGLVFSRSGYQSFTIFARTPAGWARQAGTSHDVRSLTAWREAIERGTVTPVPPRWPDLMIDGERVPLRER